MKLSEIASKPTTIKQGSVVYIVLGTPESTDYKDLRKLPHARIRLDYKWNQGTKDEMTYPTLEWLFVPERQRFNGIGVELAKKILDYLRRSKTKNLMFDNFAKELWDKVAKVFPGTVLFPREFRKRIGYFGYGLNEIT